MTIPVTDFRKTDSRQAANQYQPTELLMPIVPTSIQYTKIYVVLRDYGNQSLVSQSHSNQHWNTTQSTKRFKRSWNRSKSTKNDVILFKPLQPALIQIPCTYMKR